MRQICLKSVMKASQLEFSSTEVFLFSEKETANAHQNEAKKTTNLKSYWIVPKIYAWKALGLLNKNLVILVTPECGNCHLTTLKVCFRFHDSKSHKPAFSST